MAANDSTSYTRHDHRPTWGFQTIFVQHPELTRLRAGWNVPARQERWPVEAGVLAENPSAKIGRLGEPDRVMKWLPSPFQWDGIVNRMRDHGRGACHRAADLAALICYTGCRLSEVRRIRWEHVDFASKTLIIYGSKGRKRHGQLRIRVIPLHERLEALLKRLLSPEQLELLPTGVVAPVGKCLGTLQRACRELGFRPITHHELRRIFATWCVELGIDIPTIADMLGHADGGRLLLRRYRHLRTEHLNVVRAKMIF